MVRGEKREWAGGRQGREKKTTLFFSFSNKAPPCQPAAGHAFRRFKPKRVRTVLAPPVVAGAPPVLPEDARDVVDAAAAERVTVVSAVELLADELELPVWEGQGRT